MINFEQIKKTLTPRVSKRILMFTAAFVWAFAGALLLSKGISFINQQKDIHFLAVALALALGILFYVLLFSKISSKHIDRIYKLPVEKACFFSFFSFKSYLMMLLMISMGVGLRKLGIVPIKFMSLFYLVMGMPLCISALRFFYSAIFYDKKRA